MIYKIQDTTLEGIANAIRAKGGTNEEIQVEDFEYAILNIETGENTTLAAESARKAEKSADHAKTSELAAAKEAGYAAISEDNAEAWATGMITEYVVDENGNITFHESTPVSEYHPAYENNSKHWSDEAKAAAETAAVDAVAKVQELLNDEVEAAQTAAAEAKAAAETAVADVQELLDDEVRRAETAANNAQAAAETTVAEVQELLNDEIARAETAANDAQNAAESAVSEVQQMLNDELEQAEAAANSAKESENEAKAAAEMAAFTAESKANEVLNRKMAQIEEAVDEARSSATNAATSANEAGESAVLAEHLAETAETQANSAAESAKVAQETIWDATGATSEAWARGTMQGVEITSKEEHEAYHDNSKYWCDQARLIVQDAASSVGTANVYAQAEVTA